MEFLLDVLKILVGVIIGAVIGFFIARKYMQKYLKKNPPINEQMIKIMMQQMGRTPNQKQLQIFLTALWIGSYFDLCGLFIKKIRT